MRYEFSQHVSLNESIRQIEIKEYNISIINNIINDIFNKADALLESEEFLIEFYNDNKTKLNNFLTENVINEQEFLSYLTPIILESIFKKIWGEKLSDIQRDTGMKLAGIESLSKQADKKTDERPDFYKKAEEFKQRHFGKLKSEYEKRSGQGILGFARKIKSKFSSDDGQQKFDPYGLMSSLSPEERKFGERAVRKDLVTKAGERAVQDTYFGKQPTNKELRSKESQRKFGRRATAAKQYLDYIKSRNPARHDELGREATERTEQDLRDNKPLRAGEREAQSRRIDLSREYSSQFPSIQGMERAGEEEIKRLSPILQALNKKGKRKK